MHDRRFHAVATVSLLVAVLVPLSATRAAPPVTVRDDVTVVAVIDSGFSPYHQDFLASRVPTEVRGLPLTKAPDTWLPGFPKRTAFSSYAPLALSLDGADGTSMDRLHTQDKAAWASVQGSGTAGVNYRWIPGTKVIGALAFGPEAGDALQDRELSGAAPTIYGTGGKEHGMGTSSVAVGNVHGACPSCLLVFIQYTDQASAERALTWVHRQPWIDVVTNSYGFSSAVAVRDRVYNGTDVVTERIASERGQTTFFSAGNGLENAFTVPNSTLASSQEGPDWVVTVGATDPNGKDYTGTGKPADVAGIGVDYPSAYGSTTVSNGNRFSGTSNATPQVAGTYANALWQLRRATPGASRVQSRGWVVGHRFAAKTVRSALFAAALPTAGGYTDGAKGVAQTPPVADTRFASEGYGTYRGALNSQGGVDADVKRITGPLLGTRKAPFRPAGEKAWFVVDSWCRQQIWGSWPEGAYRSPTATPLPATDATGWPTRTAIQSGCPLLQQSSTPR
jgi:hypothetical protein